MNEDRTIFISTHQIRDLENLIDEVIIVDNGELLLNTSVAAVTDKLCFKIVKELPHDVKVLYAEDSLKGISIVQENVYGEESRVNLEHLFNAVTENPAIAKELFYAPNVPNT